MSGIKATAVSAKMLSNWRKSDESMFMIWQGGKYEYLLHGIPLQQGVESILGLLQKKHQFLNQITFIALLYQDYHMAFVSIVTLYDM